MKKNVWYLIIASILLFSCKTSITQPESIQFEFGGESIGNASFNVSQLTNDRRAKLIIFSNPIKLKITTKEQLYKLQDYIGSLDLRAQILEYQDPLKNIIPTIPFPSNEKPNPVIRTWTALDGTISIQLIEGQPLENKECTNRYTVSVKLTNVKFVTTDNKEVFILKTHIFKDIQVGWCPL